MISKLPHWVLPDIKPAFYDTESKTSIEMVAKVYAKMQELVDEYNKFVDSVNKEINDYETGINQDFECFKNNITKTCHDYIMSIDEKIKMQDLVIDNAIKYMQDNIIATSREVVNQAINNGDITIVESYENEVLSLTITDKGGNS